MNKKVKKICELFTNITEVNVESVIMDHKQGHTPTPLGKNNIGVYVFYKKENVFKVGKANQGSSSRWSSDHYNIHKGQSRFSNTIKQNINNFKLHFNATQQTELDELQDKDYPMWIKTNLSRVELKIPAMCNQFELNLLEAIAQFILQPIYEG